MKPFGPYQIPADWEDKTSENSGGAFVIIGNPFPVKASLQDQATKDAEQRGQEELEAQSKHREAQRRPRCDRHRTSVLI
jgi:hypothetical protein